MEYKYGNLLTHAKNVVVTQIVDCNGMMGENAISAFSPRSYQKYLKACETSDATSLLGSCQLTRMGDSKMAVANLFACLSPGFSFSRSVIKPALVSALKELNAVSSKYTIRVPYGFAGGFHGLDWDIVEVMLDGTLTKHKVEIWRSAK